MKKKVLLAITKSTPWGGAQKYVYDLAINLPKEHFDVCIVLGGRGELYERLVAVGVRTISITSMQRDVRLLSDLMSTIEFYRALRREKPDVLHVNSSKAGALGSVLGRMCGIRNVIFTAHGWAFKEERPRWQKSVFKILHMLTLACAHRTIAVSHKVREEAPVFNRKTTQISVIHNGIADIDYLPKADARSKLAENNASLKEMLESDPERVIIGTIAELHARKGHFDALEAYASVLPSAPGSVFVIVGEGELRARIEAAVKERRLERSVYLMGHVPEAARIVSAFDIFVLASHSEPLGYVVLEAGHASVPVIATRVGGIPEIISDDSLGILVPPHSPRDLAQALMHLITNHSSRQQLGSTLARRVREEFSFQRMIQQTSAEYGQNELLIPDGNCQAEVDIGI